MKDSTTITPPEKDNTSARTTREVEVMDIDTSNSTTTTPVEYFKPHSPVPPVRDSNVIKQSTEVISQGGRKIIEKSDDVQSFDNSDYNDVKKEENKCNVSSTADVMTRRTGEPPPTIQTNTKPYSHESVLSPTSSAKSNGLSPSRSHDDLLPSRKVMYLRQGSRDDSAVALFGGAKVSQTSSFTTSKSPTTTTAPEISSPSVPTKSLQRQPSQDDTCIVKCETNFINRVLNIPNAIKESFPSFDIFKSNVQAKKTDLFDLHMIDSVLLYDLLDRLSWSFSFQVEKRKILTQRLLRADGKSYTRAIIQSLLEQDFNISIGDYEADMLLKYAAMYVDHFHESNSVRLYDDPEKDKIEREGFGATYYFENDDLPFSLLIPHNIKRSKWMNFIDRLAIRQFNEATNREATNMKKMSGGFHLKNQKRNRKSKNNLLSMSSRKLSVFVAAGRTRRIRKKEINEYRAAVVKKRPKRKLTPTNAYPVKVSVYREVSDRELSQGPTTMREQKISKFQGSTYTSFNGRVYAMSKEGEIVHVEGDDDPFIGEVDSEDSED
jgi:hypothetical protein